MATNETQQTDAEIETVDLGTGVPKGSVEKNVGPVEVEIRYNPDRDRETKRGQIATRLVGLLAFLTVAPLALSLFKGICGRAVSGPDLIASCGGFPTMELMDYMTLVFTPIVALVGAATGFYFGERAGEKKAGDG